MITHNSSMIPPAREQLNTGTWLVVTYVISAVKADTSLEPQ